MFRQKLNQVWKYYRFNSSKAIATLIMSFGLITTSVLVFADRQIIIEEEKESAIESLNKIKASLEQGFFQRLTLVISLAAFVESHEDLKLNNPSEEELFQNTFEKFTSSLNQQVTGVVSLQLAPDGIVTYLSNVDRNRQAIGHDLLKDDSRREQIFKTIKQRGIIVAGPLQLIQGGEAIIARQAIFTKPGAYNPQRYVDQNRFQNDEPWLQDIPPDFWGFATALIDVNTLYKEAGLDNLPHNYQYAVRGRHGLGKAGEVFWGDPKIFNSPLATMTINLPNGEWIVAVKIASQVGIDIWRSIIIALIGTSISALLGASIIADQERNKANRISKAKSEFLAMMSHEIRTPLNGVMGMTSLLMETTLTLQQKDLVNTILHSSENLLVIINDILDISKIEANRIEIEEKSFDLGQCLDSIYNLLAPQIKIKQLRFHCQIDENISQFIVGDESRLRQILLNLISNAIKFTPRGNVSINVTLKNDSPESFLLFSIADTGIGIKPKHQEKLFQPFSQADSSVTRKYGGTGLGLVISQRLCDLMKGKIWFQSQVGQGTTFFVQLPYKPNTSMSTSFSSPLKSVNSDEDFVKILQEYQAILKILVVEDAPNNQMIMNLMLEKLGYQADFANNGLEAISALKNQAYDLVFMDWQMPEIDGMEATRKIRQKNTNIQQPWIIGLTANAMLEQKQAYLNAGMNDYLSKPVTIQEIAQAILNYLEVKQSRIIMRKTD